MAIPAAPTALDAPVGAPNPGLFDGQLVGAPDPLATAPVATDAGPPVDVPQDVPAAAGAPVADPLQVDPAQGGGEIQTAGFVTEIVQQATESLARKGKKPSVGGPTIEQQIRGDDDSIAARFGGPGEEGSGFTIIREADEAEIAEFRSTIGNSTGKPSPSLNDRLNDMPVTSFNLENINSTDDLKQTIDSIAQMWDEAGRRAGRGKMTFKEIEELGDKMGFGPTVSMILKRGEGDLFNAEQTSSALRAMAVSAMELSRLAKIASTSVDAQELLKFRQHFGFHAAISIQMRGASMEAARAFGAWRINRTPGSDSYLKQVDIFMGEMGGEQSVRDMAKAYLAIDDVGGRNRFTMSGWQKVKGAYMEVLIGGMLSNPATILANATGNTAFSILTLLETPVEIAVSKAMATMRLNGGQQAASWREVYADMTGFLGGIGDGLQLAGTAFRTNAPVRDVASKVAAANRRVISGDVLAPNSPEYFQLGLDWLGVAIGSPGRVLLATDEFFKGVAYRRATNRAVVKRIMEMRDAGSPTDDIVHSVENILLGVDDQANDAAEAFAQYSTFTRPVGGTLGKVGNAIQGTMLGRMMMPFFRTPVQVASVTFARTPLLGVVASIKNIKDPAKRNAAMARHAFATAGTAWLVSEFGQSGKLTGGGPQDPDLRKQLQDVGWQEYSLAFAKEGIDKPRWLKVGHVMVRHPDDVNYYSYERFEPVGAMLAFAAEFSQRAYWPARDEEGIGELAAASAAAMFTYAKTKTFLQSFTSIAGLLSARNGEQAAKVVERFLGGLVTAQKPFSSALGAIERNVDPTIPATGIDRNNVMVWREMESILSRYDSNNPWAEGGGPVLRDVWGNPRHQKNSTVLSSVLPPMIADILGDDIDGIMADPVKLKILEAGVPLTMPPKKIKGVVLTPEEYETFVILAGAPPPFSKVDKYNDVIPGEMVEPLSLYDELKDLFDYPGYDEIPPADQQAMIKDIRAGMQETALDMMLYHPDYEEQFRDLRIKIEEAEAMAELPEQVK